ncbi:MAG TPA: hypothetical protein VHD90_22010 [Phototrophicaceae bacterium]|nr:hypothetical protein [Phototrophicaceae bacterium]
MVVSGAACQPQATPLPNILPTLPPATATSSPYTATPAPIRYAIAPDVLPYLTDQNQSLISATAHIVKLDAPPHDDDLGTVYDLVVGLGDLPNGTRTPSPLQVDLVIDSSLPPLNNAKLVDLLRRALDPNEIAALLKLPGASAVTESPSDASVVAWRNDLANAGYPDGFDVTLHASFIPGAQALTQLLSAYGIDVHELTNPGEAAQFTLTSEPPQGANAIPLYSIPISYRAVDGLKITFTPSGFPIAQRGG